MNRWPEAPFEAHHQLAVLDDGFRNQGAGGSDGLRPLLDAQNSLAVCTNFTQDLKGIVC